MTRNSAPTLRSLGRLLLGGLLSLSLNHISGLSSFPTELAATQCTHTKKPLRVKSGLKQFLLGKRKSRFCTQLKPAFIG